MREKIMYVHTEGKIGPIDIRSAFLSKINWTQAVAFAAMVFTMFGIDVPDDVQAHIVVGIGAMQAVLTWVFRTWFTKTITPGSAEGVGK